MKKIFLLFALIFSLGAVFAQGPSIFNDPDARSRNLGGPFHAIDVSDGIELFLVAGTTDQLAVSLADQSYDDKFKTEVVDGVLKIYYKRDQMKIPKGRKLNLKAYVSCKNLDQLEASAGSSVHLPEGITVPKLSVKLTSGALMEGRVDIGDLRIVQNSGSVIQITGKSGSADLDLSSGATFKSPDFSTRACTAEASSGARIRIGIQDELVAKATSGGSIHYNGTGVIKDIKVNSGGVVKKV